MTRTPVSEAWLAVRPAPLHKTGGVRVPSKKNSFSHWLTSWIRRWLFLFIETRIVHGHILRVNHYLQCSGWWLLLSLWRCMHLSGLQHLLLPKVGAFQGSACLWDCVTKPCSDYRNSGQHHSSEIHMNNLVAHTWVCLSNFNRWFAEALLLRLKQIQGRKLWLSQEINPSIQIDAR